MDSQSENEKPQLLEKLIQYSGIPREILEQELQAILEKKGLNLRDLTLEQLRSVTATYFRQIIKSILTR